jgi:hypothetical protein
MENKATKLPGRSSEYRPEMCKQIIRAMSEGLSLDAAAGEIGISPRSACQWQRDIPEFSQAIETGRAKALLIWERRALAVAGGDAGNVAIMSLALRNLSRAASGEGAGGRCRLAGWPAGRALSLGRHQPPEYI